MKSQGCHERPAKRIPMKLKTESIPFQLSLIRIKHENVSWSNILIDSPITYNLLERRTMYFLTGEVKRKFVEKGLGVPDNWKDLYFYLTDEEGFKRGIFGLKKGGRCANVVQIRVKKKSSA